MGIVAITKDRIYLLDYEGKDKASTRILFDFTKAECTIKSRKRGLVHHTFTISEEDSSAAIECDLGLLANNKEMNREVIEQLKLISKNDNSESDDGESATEEKKEEN